MSRVSVVIPMYNSKITILKAINSVLEQTYQNIMEIIVVNDGSTDDSESILREYIMENNLGELIRIVNKPNGGAATARNTGLENSQGEFIAFLDADDRWKKEKISKQMNVFNWHREVGLVGSNLNEEHIERFFLKKFDYYTEIKLMDLIFKNFFQTSTVIIRREILETVGFLNSKQTHAEEGNYFLRIAAKYKCILVNEGLVEFGDGKPGFGHSGLSANLKEMEKGELKNLQMAYESNYISSFIYGIAVFYSIVKYVRRIIITKTRNIKNKEYQIMLEKIRIYGILKSMSMLIDVIRTKLIFKEASLIRFPMDIRGKQHISIAKGFTAGTGCRIEAYPAEGKTGGIKIGKNVQINDYVHITAINSVIIEDNVLIASKVYISDCLHGSYSGQAQSKPDEIVKDRKLSHKPVLIKENAWLGDNVAILPGTIVGRNSIIGANSVVSQSIPDNVIAVGAPAKVIKKYNDTTERWERVMQ